MVDNETEVALHQPSGEKGFLTVSLMTIISSKAGLDRQRTLRPLFGSGKPELLYEKQKLGSGHL